MNGVAWLGAPPSAGMPNGLLAPPLAAGMEKEKLVELFAPGVVGADTADGAPNANVGAEGEDTAIE